MGSHNRHAQQSYLPDKQPGEEDETAAAQEGLETGEDDEESAEEVDAEESQGEDGGEGPGTGGAVATHWLCWLVGTVELSGR